MNGRKIAGVAAIAILSAMVALFVYTRFLDEPFKTGSANVDDQVPAHFTNVFTAPQEGLVDFSEVAENIVHTVVHVKTKTIQNYSYRNPIMEFFYGEQSSQPREVRGYGSGVIISSDGYIITNNHVIEGADEVDVTLNDNRTFHANVIGRDPSTDIAVLKIDSKGLPFVRYGDSDKLKLGQWVVAIGNPFNLTSTVTAGIVSAKGRSLGLLDSQYRIESFIQTDAALNSGNSGGALVNTMGELVGITTAIISPSGAYAGNSFAIPINIVKKVVADLQEYGEVQRAIIGVNITDVTSELAEEENIKDPKGVYITEIVPGGAAEEAGMKTGDVIVNFDGKKTDTAAELQERVSSKRPGDRVEVVVLRNNRKIEYDIVLRNLAGGTDVVEAGGDSGVIFGVRLEPLTTAEKSEYRLTAGMKVTNVQDGRFEDLGIREGYIIFEINGEEISTYEDVKTVTRNGSELKSLRGLQSNGTFFSYQFRQ
ncbi:MAG: Do family serine endopeptidase [Bacteroidales bacterium]|jgi:Do/DeqQ family serine protease|nr:Do family serine endopeptidase [Bacteroidales bacterium]